MCMVQESKKGIKGLSLLLLLPGHHMLIIGGLTLLVPESAQNNPDWINVIALIVIIHCIKEICWLE